MSDLFRDAKIGNKIDMVGKTVECIHINYEYRNVSPPGCYPHYSYVNSNVVFAYLNNDGEIKTIELKG